jgi:hypothetical protein
MSQPIPPFAGNLLDGALSRERCQHSGGGRLREIDPLGDLCDPDRALGEDSEHRKGAFD